MQNRFFLTTVMLLCINALLFAQSSNQNYILTRTFMDKEGTLSKSLQTIQYFDGLGRPIQTVKKGFTPAQKDLVTLQEYDNLGRPSNRWLPAPLTTNSGNYTDPATVKSAAKGAVNSNDQAPFFYPVYEPSPLNRVEKQFGPGKLWHDNGKCVKTEYKTNLADGDLKLVCAEYTVSGNSLKRSGNYAACQLYVTETTDEDGCRVLEFTDKLGRTLLLRRIGDNNATHDIYYVYDDFGNLSFMLPPLAADNLTSGTWDSDNAFLKNYGYVYRYDSRNRLVWKQLPGCEHIDYVYDKADRLIFWRDGELRKDSLWMFAIPDDFGRAVTSGICGNAIDGLSVNGTHFKDNIVKATKRSNINSGLYGYDIYRGTSTISANGLAGLTVLTVNFYDDYNFLDLNTISNIKTALSYDINEHTDFRTMYGSLTDMVAHKGKLTGTIVKMLESNSLLYSAFYYDYRGRVIQTKSTNHLGGFEKEYVKYDFIGNPEKRLLVHITNPTAKGFKEEYVYEYDHAGRLKKIKHKLNNATTEKLLADNIYDEAGRLKTTGNVATATVLYTYDVRSRLKSISSSTFCQYLSYTHGGNIDTIMWKDNSIDSFSNGYAFTYDKLSRLVCANNSPFFGVIGKYSENFEYDKHGNITKLIRTSHIPFVYSIYPKIVNNLQLEYDGNKLKKVTDTSLSPYTGSDGYFFKDWNPSTPIDYTYNTNGAMTKDENKGMTVEYNILNLPKLAGINNPISNGTTNYYYSADGIKRRVTHSWYVNFISKPEMMLEISAALEIGFRGGENKEEEEEKENEGRGISASPLNLITRTTDYIGNKIYVNGNLDKILIPNGYIKDNNYHFYIKDHLGNNRVTIKETGKTVVQRVDYYPSGLPFPGGLNPDEQQFKHNSCEFDPMHGLNFTDHRNRYLDHATNRYTTPDRFAEKFPWQSPYVHAGNNAATYIDVNGDSINVSNMQLLDQVLNTNYTQTIINDLQSQTGLTYGISSAGALTYAKDENGNPIISTTTDSNGNTVQVGSATARDLMTNAIDHQDWITVAAGTTSHVPQGTNTIGLNFKQIENFIIGTVGMDNRTLGWGMTLMHEINHTKVGGGLRDTPGNPGPTVTKMNTIRSELNALGGNYGQRLDYYGTQIGGNVFLPFNRPAKEFIILGIPPGSAGPNKQYIKY